MVAKSQADRDRRDHSIATTMSAELVGRVGAMSKFCCLAARLDNARHSLGHDDNVVEIPMGRTSSLLRKGALGGGGILVGFAVATLLTIIRTDDAQDSVRVEEPGEARPSEPPPPPTIREIRVVQGAPIKEENPRTQQSSFADDDFEIPSDEERLEAIERWHDQLAEHQSEPVDPSWARPAEALLDEDFVALGEEAGFEFIDVTCASTTCVATVEWPSYHEAAEGYSEILHHRFRQNCGRVITIEPADNPEDVYRMPILFECAEGI